MSDKPKRKNSVVSWCVLALMAAVAIAAVYTVKNVLSDDSRREKTSIATVTLLKPPPPPQIKEKPPLPEPPKEIQKKEDIIDPGPKNEPNPQNNNQDNAPAGDKLGLDAEGGAGSDAFGLVGKKGGRSILSGGAGGNGLGRLSLLSKFGGYAHVVETEIRKEVVKRLNEEGGVPRGKHQAIARISIDSNGAVLSCKITGSSGIHNIDEAIEQALAQFKISEPPPDGMPRKMDIRFTYQT